MQKWEHMSIQVHDSLVLVKGQILTEDNKPIAWKNYLDKLGLEGWEMCGILPDVIHGLTVGNYHTFYFKRPTGRREEDV